MKGAIMANVTLARGDDGIAFITFIERPGMSQVMTAMPSSPRAEVTFAMMAPFKRAR